MLISQRICVLAAILTPAFAFGSSDTVILHGHIYTGNEKAPWAEALAITGTRIDAVGTDKEISSLSGPNTKIIDAQGKTVIPGISDGHTHMWFGALALRGFNFSTPEFRLTPDEPRSLSPAIKAYADSHPKDKVIFGRAAFTVGPNSNATHQLLDRAVPDRPLVIHATSEHQLWVNAKALTMAGITDKPVSDPLEEKYVARDAQGQPTGVLIDPAMQLMVRALPAEPLEQRMAALETAAHYLNSFGVTSVVNATGNLKEIEVYAALHAKGRLTVRTRTAFAEVSVNHHLTPQFLADLEKARTTYHDDWVSANLVKFFSDGAGATTSRFDHDDDGEHTPGWYEPADYQKIVMELDKRGYQVMTHAIGNAASRMVLNAYEAVEKTNGPRDRRFRMEHVSTLTPADIPRFFKLGVIPDMQPAFCCSATTTLPISNQWQSLLKANAKLAFSSDWPCSWPPDPFMGIQQTLQRQVRRFNPVSTDPIQYSTPEEHLTVEQALRSYTKNSAYARFSDKDLGSLEPGKLADLVVLSQDIFTVPTELIGKTKPVMTMAGGKVVFEKK